MPDPNDLSAFFEQVTQAQSGLVSLFGGALPPDMAAHAQRIQQELPAIKAQAEAQLKQARDMQVEQENYLKRLRGEEVESDKEKEGDLDTALDRFEAEYRPKPEEADALIQLLLQVVEPEQPPGAKPRR